MFGLEVTLAILGAALAVFIVATIRARRPYEPGKVRMIPLGAIQFAALVVVVLMLGHLVSLLTGTPLQGRLHR